MRVLPQGHFASVIALKTSGYTFVILIIAVVAVSCSKTVVKNPTPRETAVGLSTTTLEVMIDGITRPSGVMRVALFDSPDGFPGEMENVFRRIEVPVTDQSVTVTWANVPPGRYAVSVHHDIDENGRIETDFFGRPSEGYGTSNNVRGRFGPPKFTEAAIEVATEPVKVRITLIGGES
jgi:uncharacterized protein (DUF2141 family)